MELLTEIQSKEYIKCAINFEYFCENYLKIENRPAQKFIPLKLFEYQHNLFKSFEEDKKIINHGYRQCGLTTLTLAYITWKIIFNDNFSILFVDFKLNIAQKNLEEITRFIDLLPDFFKIQTVFNTKDFKKFDNGSIIRAISRQSHVIGVNSDIIVVDNAEYNDNFINYNIMSSNLIINSTTGISIELSKFAKSNNIKINSIQL